MESSSFSKNKCTNKQHNEIKPFHSRKKILKLGFQLNSVSPVFWVLELSALQWTHANCCVRQTRVGKSQQPPQLLFFESFEREWLRTAESQWRKYNLMEGMSQTTRTFWKISGSFLCIISESQDFSKENFKQES